MDSLIIKRTAQENLSSDNEAPLHFDDDVLDWISRNCPGWNNEGIEKTYMIPPTFPDIPKQDNKGHLTEKYVFDILGEFGDKTKQPMFVVHSHRFSELLHKFEDGNVKNSDSHWLRGEADFVIIHRKLGVIFLQVKAASIKTAREYRVAEVQLNKDQTALTCALKRLTISELERKLSQEEEKNKQIGLQGPERKRENKKKCNELERRVEKEMNKYPGFVVMPNCSREKAGERKGCFKEDIQTVEQFKMWWEKNMHREEDLEFSQDMYERMAICFVGPRVFNESCLLKHVIDKTHKRLIRVTKSQLSIMTQDVPKQDIVGPAGSGKTWLLLEKAKQLAGELKDKERILIMCFNKPLSVYLTTEFKEFKSKVVIKTFVSMLMEITGETLPGTDAEKTKLVSKCVHKLNQKSMHAQAKSDPTYKYEHVFVDEGQDMFGEWRDLNELLKLLHADSDEERRYRWVFFDNNQSVHFGAQINIPKKIINNAKQMTENVRNTLNIFECSQKFLSPTVGAKLGHGISGLPVKWIDSLPTSTHLSPLEQLQKGAELVTQEIAHLDSESVARSDIVVLTNNTTERDKVCSVFWSNNILTQNAENAILSPDNAITVDSIRRFKGLERKVVILLDPPIDKKWKADVNYVAMSRCFCLLVIVTSREKKQKYEEFTLELAEGEH